MTDAKLTAALQSGFEPFAKAFLKQPNKASLHVFVGTGFANAVLQIAKSDHDVLDGSNAHILLTRSFNGLVRFLDDSRSPNLELSPV